jgi:twitching motility protein PilT
LKPPILARTVEAALSKGVKSIFFFAGCPPLGNRRDIMRLGEPVLANRDVEEALRSTSSALQYAAFEREKELDYGFSLEGLGRFRVNAFRRRGSLGMVIRPIPNSAPPFETLNLPAAIKEFTSEKDGLVLVTGPAGSGKSTTLASLIDLINRERSCHIVTVEDPIEFVYTPARSIISQREVGKDTLSFSHALKRLLREDADVVLIGEIRDRESMRAAIEMAETGQLVFATLHTSSAFQTINRVLDFFSEGERRQMQSQVSEVLRGIVSQRLLVRSDGAGFVCACEIMKASRSLKNLIRTDKVHQINSILDISGKEGMVSMDDALLDLYRKGLADLEDVYSHSSGGRGFQDKLALITGERPRVTVGTRVLSSAPDRTVYVVDFRQDQLGNLDSSGMLLVSASGLVFRASGEPTGGFHFIADYAILKGKQDLFTMGSLFRVSYKSVGSGALKKAYPFYLRVVGIGKEDFEIPVQLGLIGDGNWYTLDVAIPEAFHGKEVRSFMLLFDSALSEIVFSDIRFLR